MSINKVHLLFTDEFWPQIMLIWVDLSSNILYSSGSKPWAFIFQTSLKLSIQCYFCPPVRKTPIYLKFTINIKSQKGTLKQMNKRTAMKGHESQHTI